MRKLFGPIPEIRNDQCLSWNVEVAPCQEGCPLGIDVEGYTRSIANANFNLALEIIKQDCPLPGVCAYVCYAPCEGFCKRGKLDTAIAIRNLKQAAVDLASKSPDLQGQEAKIDGEKVAIIGSGPAGLSCSYYLSKQGYQVTIFEALPFIGGMLRVGIPEYRLPKYILDSDIEGIKRMGVEIRTASPINSNFPIEALFNKGYKAVFIGTGAHKSRRLGIPGEDSAGIIYGLDFLKELNLGGRIEIGKRVAVIGGGNVAIDSARCARRLGSSVSIFYRRSKEEMPAFDSEIKAAESEGIIMDCLVDPTNIQVVGGKVVGIRCIRMELGAIDVSGRRQSIEIRGSEFDLDIDTVILAIGETPDLSFIGKDSGIEMTKEGWITVDPVTLSTRMEGIFAGGDVNKGPSTAISAMADGKQAAASIHYSLTGERLKGKTAAMHAVTMGEMLPRGIIPRNREEIHVLPEIVRIRAFKEVSLGLTPNQAIREAKRCLRCRTCNRCLEDFDCVAILPCENNKKLSPRIDNDLCVGCQVCIQVCPYGSICKKEEN